MLLLLNSSGIAIANGVNLEDGMAFGGYCNGLSNNVSVL
jgi:hypothetical protein